MTHRTVALEPCSAPRVTGERRSALMALLCALCRWDAATFIHSDQVARGVMRLAPADQTDAWYWAGLLHDIGKLAVRPAILRKRGALTAAERAVMQEHPRVGAALLKALGAPPAIAHGALFHHERWDGAGYPRQLGARQIPAVARALTVVDAYMVLTSTRPYRAAFAPAHAQREIERNAGTQFDPAIVARFFEGMPEP